jgi:hypothetical protein
VVSDPHRGRGHDDHDVLRERARARRHARRRGERRLEADYAPAQPRADRTGRRTRRGGP